MEQNGSSGPAFKTENDHSGFVRIVLRDMAVKLRIGLLEEEKTRRQTVLVNVALYADRESYLKNIEPGNIIDYMKIVETLRMWERREDHTLLLETYARELLATGFSLPGVRACSVSLMKTEIIEKAFGAGVEIFMTREDFENL